MLKNLLPVMQSYMLNSQNMAKGYNSRMQEHIVIEPVIREATVAQPITIVHHVPAKPFTPFQKDKLFWCFFIILKGHEEYEMNHSNSFSLEKKIKIETVEKLKSIKEKLKELKLKRTELEDNLVNSNTISIKGLCALCLVHNISITYVYPTQAILTNGENHLLNGAKVYLWHHVMGYRITLKHPPMVGRPLQL